MHIGTLRLTSAVEFLWSVFLRCQAPHDWVDEYCLTVLEHLRSAADSKIELVVVKQVIATREIPGPEIPVRRPPPRLRNLGHVCLQEYLVDMMVRKPVRHKPRWWPDFLRSTARAHARNKVMSLFGGQERTAQSSL